MGYGGVSERTFATSCLVKEPFMVDVLERDGFCAKSRPSRVWRPSLPVVRRQLYLFGRPAEVHCQNQGVSHGKSAIFDWTDGSKLQ